MSYERKRIECFEACLVKFPKKEEGRDNIRFIPEHPIPNTEIVIHDHWQWPVRGAKVEGNSEDCYFDYEQNGTMVHAKKRQVVNMHGYGKDIRPESEIVCFVEIWETWKENNKVFRYVDFRQCDGEATCKVTWLHRPSRTFAKQEDYFDLGANVFLHIAKLKVHEPVTNKCTECNEDETRCAPYDPAKHGPYICAKCRYKKVLEERAVQIAALREATKIHRKKFVPSLGSNKPAAQKQFGFGGFGIKFKLKKKDEGTN